MSKHNHEVIAPDGNITTVFKSKMLKISIVTKLKLAAPPLCMVILESRALRGQSELQYSHKHAGMWPSWLGLLTGSRKSKPRSCQETVETPLQFSHVFRTLPMHVIAEV